jgi:hypothetical protein
MTPAVLVPVSLPSSLPLITTDLGPLCLRSRPVACQSNSVSSIRPGFAFPVNSFFVLHLCFLGSASVLDF